ncbi:MULTISPECIES: monovalent cation/H(+) antiporter subunit G [Bradyrhizobium]|uniref:Putative K(+)/H(+) antiporter subunit G n=1 Tax=Bradyrhizobium vignae TaxID=1549949 RepID=A0A2U3PRB4_9BRAD|nr:monovalent cation/H(+) antiporter subunit G [Bradyrhizobium vignae]RXH00317.1 potassium:proton antiporter [Bradyrhizobium vignae]SPP91687.1 putative K(+)/H(+) antiporter subunit G [Bradyrhizobium vignae]
MNGIEHLPPWAAVLTAVFLLTGAAVTLIGSLGLLRLGTFYERVHAPTLGTTLGTVFIAAASMVCFSVLESRAVLHEILIVVLGAVTTPIALTVLVGAARFRDTAERAQLGEPVGRALPHAAPGDASAGKAD